MKRALVCGALNAAVVLAGCSPSIDPAAKADVDARIANLPVQSVTIAAPPAGALAPMPLAAGQWAQYRLRLQDGQQELKTVKIIKQEGNAFWYEVVDDTYQGRTIEQLKFTFGNDINHPRVELLALRRKEPSGRVEQAGASDLAWPLVTYNDYREGVAALVAPWPQQPQAPTVVQAGRFDGCYYNHEVTPRTGRDPWVTDSWWHPSVPISGMVRLQNNQGLVKELVAYGSSGARSDF